MASFKYLVLLAVGMATAVGCRGKTSLIDTSDQRSDGSDVDVDVDPGIEFSPPGRAFSGTLDVTLSTTESGATIHYTVDRTAPSSGGSSVQRYDGALSLSATTMVRAQLQHADGSWGPVATQSYLQVEENFAAFSSNLPIVVIDTFGNDIDAEAEERPYRPAMTVFIETDEGTGRATTTDPAQFSGYAGIHVRGQSSTDYEKKQYKLELRDEKDEDMSASLLGLPRESDWILHAPYSDKTLMRNHLIYKWSNDLGRYAPRTRFVELFATWDEEPLSMDHYRGVYILMEKIKRDGDRVDVEKLGPDDNSNPDVTGGYLLSHDWESEIEGFEGEVDFTSERYEDRINYEYPKPENITEAQKAYIQRYIDDFETALSSSTLADGDSGYAGFIDVGSFIDLMLMVELGRNVDGYVLSTYMHKPRNGKLAMGPVWDFNGALGNASYFDAEVTEGWHYENDAFPEDNPEAFAWWEVLLQDRGFTDLRAQRWREARAGVLATAQLEADIDETAALLDEAQARNFEKWPILGEEIWPNDPGAEARGSYAAEVAYLKDWVLARAEWIDGAVEP